MKKTYMAPSTEVVEIETTEMLDMSFNATLGSKETDGVNGNQALGKERGIDSAFGDLW